MISRTAIESFLHQPFESVQWIKQVRQSEMERELANLPIPRSQLFVTEPYDHQLLCFFLAITHPQFAFFLDMGLGKSKIMLDAASYFIARGTVRRVLVLVPYRINLYSWEEQCEQHAPHLTYQILAGSTTERWQEIQTSSAHIFILNYDGLMHMASAIAQVQKTAVQKTRGEGAQPPGDPGTGATVRYGRAG